MSTTVPTTPEAVTSRRPTLRETLAARRARRAARLRLERDLATYRTPAERREIETIVARYAGEDGREVGEILSRQASGRLREERQIFTGAH